MLVEDDVRELVVFYDRWTLSGPLALSGFGVDPKQKPVLPMEPEERVTETIELDIAPESIFPQTIKKITKGVAKSKSVKQAEAPAPKPMRLYLALGIGLLAWVAVLAALYVSAQLKPVVLATSEEMPEGLALPFAYQDATCVEHAGWLYIEGTLGSTAFERVHADLRWQVIAQDETLQVMRPQVLDAKAHERSEFSFASGLGNVEQWRKDNFLTVTDGYFTLWPDGSQMVYEVGSDRVYARLSREVANELFSR